MPPYDLAIIGAGAAGLMAAITAARANPAARVILLDGAAKLGSKILVAGGGRCNVTHYEVDERQYAGSTPTQIRKVLRQFDVTQTIAFFAALGVQLKREETGKLFPTTDDAHTVLDALLTAARGTSVEIRNPWRVQSITKTADGFTLHQAASAPTSPAVVGDSPSAPVPRSHVPCLLPARRVILATGGKSLPRTGSDGHGFSLAQSLGHSLTPRLIPALVPLTLPRDHPLCSLSGLTLPATLDLRAASGKKLKSFTNSTLLTHFGLSGPSVLDISRYYTLAKLDDPETTLNLNVTPESTPEAIDQFLIAARTSKLSIGRTLVEFSIPNSPPERLARVLCTLAQLEPTSPVSALTRDQRRALVTTLTALPLPITGDRGYTYAEVTAGGVPLAELNLDTLESGCCPNLHLCGEILDVDGRIGGFNFQWAWASGYVAGQGAISPLL